MITGTVHSKLFGSISPESDKIQNPTTSDTAPLLAKTREACRMLACGQTRLYELITTGELDSFIDGRLRKISIASIHRYIAKRLAA